jgi:coenzyme F420-0:L-glutamate ligase/coenzyme F420-1:gamma-L-glutamate ligase
MRLEEAVAARRSVRAFEDRRVPREAVERALRLAIQSPAPHHSSPWRFVLIEEAPQKERFSLAMGTAWLADLRGDGMEEVRARSIVDRSHRLLMSTPLLTVCCADMSRSHDYSDEERRLAEWSLFAHSTGAALQTYMLGLAEAGIASCWISAPVFCRHEVQRAIGLGPQIEPQALVLVGYPDPGYQARPRPKHNLADYLLPPDSLDPRE